MAELNLYIKDLETGSVFKYGEDCHDSLQVWDGELRYSNLQNGDGSPYGYCFCNEDGSTNWLGEGAEYDEKYVHIGRVQEPAEYDVLLRRYKHAIKVLQAIAQHSGRDKHGCWDEWSEARAFTDCKNAAYKCLQYLDEPTVMCNNQPPDGA